MAMENSLRLSISPSIVRFTMCVKNRHKRTDEMNPGLFTTRANWSRTAVTGTGCVAELAGDFSDGEPEVDTCFSPPFIILQKLGRVTASLRWLTASRGSESLVWNPVVLSESRCNQTSEQEQ